VPFGGGNRPKLGVVFELAETTDAKNAKTVLSVVSSDISLDTKMLDLAIFIKSQTLCTMGDAIHAMVPSAVLSKLIEYYSAAESISPTKQNALPAQDLFVLEYIQSRERVSLDSIKNKFGARASESVDSLLSAKLITKELVIKDSEESRTETVYSLTASHLPHVAQLIGGERVDGIKLVSEKHKAIVSALKSGDTLSPSEICKVMGLDGGNISPQLKALCEK
jgi:primosomal protein N'